MYSLDTEQFSLMKKKLKYKIQIFQLPPYGV